MFAKIKKMLVYFGADPISVSRASATIDHVNNMAITTLSLVATFLIGAMLIFTIKSASMRQNQMVYVVGTIISVVICLLSLPARKYTRVNGALIFLAYSVYYLYGIFLGIVTDPAGKTVTFIAMLGIIPPLFVIPPIWILTVTLGYDILFIILCFVVKTGSVLSKDVADAIVFGILGVATGSWTNYIRVKGYISEQKIQEISRVDQLTGVNNRNAYELDLFSITEGCKHSIACIYIDVNGLHELNNTKGHAHGDIMLKTIAQQIQEVFSTGKVYRTGGDEFVVFVPDISRADVGVLSAKLIEELEKKSYHIAVGYETREIRYLSVESLIKDAEVAMFKNKEHFYKDLMLRNMRT